MGTKMSRHRLTEINLEARTALCSVCGPTEIYLSRPRTKNPPEVYFVQQARELREYMRAWRQRRQPARRPRHLLREIDEEKRSAVCAICGPTAVYRYKSKGLIHYRCATYAGEINRRNKSAHLIPSSASVHILSAIDEENYTAICAKCGPVRIDWKPGFPSAAGHLGAVPTSGVSETESIQVQENTRIVYEYKRRHACKRCGSMAILEPDGFLFFEMQFPEEQRISVLVEKTEPEELVAELEKRDMYCKNCLWLVIRAFTHNTPVLEFRPFPTHFSVQGMLGMPEGTGSLTAVFPFLHPTDKKNTEPFKTLVFLCRFVIAAGRVASPACWFHEVFRYHGASLQPVLYTKLIPSADSDL
jgi:hypothetical protein